MLFTFLYNFEYLKIHITFVIKNVVIKYIGIKEK